jgi:hypothetical protein
VDRGLRTAKPDVLQVLEKTTGWYSRSMFGWFLSRLQGDPEEKRKIIERSSAFSRPGAKS